MTTLNITDKWFDKTDDLIQVEMTTLNITDKWFDKTDGLMQVERSKPWWMTTLNITDKWFDKMDHLWWQVDLHVMNNKQASNQEEGWSLTYEVLDQGFTMLWQTSEGKIGVFYDNELNQVSMDWHDLPYGQSVDVWPFLFLLFTQLVHTPLYCHANLNNAWEVSQNLQNRSNECMNEEVHNCVTQKIKTTMQVHSFRCTQMLPQAQNTKTPVYQYNPLDLCWTTQHSGYIQRKGYVGWFWWWWGGLCYTDAHKPSYMTSNHYTNFTTPSK